MGWLEDFFNSPTNQVNPYTSSWMTGAQNQNNDLMSLLFGGGGNNGMLAGFMGDAKSMMNPDWMPKSDAFMKQFLSYTPQFQGLTQTASDAERARAMELGQEGQAGAASGFAGLGSLYSGANLLAGNKAYQSSMGDLAGRQGDRNAAMLQMLYGTAMPALMQSQNQGVANKLQSQGLGLQAQGQGLSDLFGFTANNQNNIANASSPIFQQQASPFSNLMQGLGGLGSLAGGIGSLATGIPGLGAALGGLFGGGAPIPSNLGNPIFGAGTSGMPGYGSWPKF